ncbi:thiolase family protein [Thermodesulfobacteriota bacterium]
MAISSDMKQFKDKVAVVGVGNTCDGPLYRTKEPLRTSYGLGLEAFKNALEDSGLSKKDIDGLAICRIPSYVKMSTMLGLQFPNWLGVYEGSGRMAGAALQGAAMAIYSGMADYVAIIYGNDGRSVGATYGGEAKRALDSFNAPYGMTSPGASHALMWQRYMHEYNTSEETLGRVAISFRKYASLNSDAVMREPMTMEDYLNVRYIVYPLRRYDYCLINDGGCAMILTGAERAKDCKKPPVYIMGTAQRSELTEYYHNENYFWDSMEPVRDRVFDMAGVGSGDIDVLEIYDNFLTNIIFSLDGFGFTPKGEAGHWINEGHHELGGSLPINTHGAHSSCSYMQGHGHQIEAVRQARGECGPRQSPKHELVQYICSAPITTSHIFHT